MAKITRTQQTLKGSALYIAGLLTSMGASFVLSDGKELIGALFLTLGAAIYLVREYLLKK